MVRLDHFKHSFATIPILHVCKKEKASSTTLHPPKTPSTIQPLQTKPRHVHPACQSATAIAIPPPRHHPGYDQSRWCDIWPPISCGFRQGRRTQLVGGSRNTQRKGGGSKNGGLFFLRNQSSLKIWQIFFQLQLWGSKMVVIFCLH